MAQRDKEDYTVFLNALREALGLDPLPTWTDRKKKK